MSDLIAVMDENGEIVKFIFNPQYSKTYDGGLDSIGNERKPTDIKPMPDCENEKLTHFFWVKKLWEMLPPDIKENPKANLWWQAKRRVDKHGVGFYSNPKKVAGSGTIDSIVKRATTAWGIKVERVEM